MVGTHPVSGEARGFGWFADDEGGRFNLEAPRGTCYLARSRCAAAWEACGPTLAAAPALEAAFAHSRWLWSVTTTDVLVLARLRGPGANAYGVTGELDQGAFPSYAIPRAWAARFDELRFDGISYEARHATGCEDPGAVAVFDRGGEHDGRLRAVDSPVRLTFVAADIGIALAPSSTASAPPPVSAIP